MPDISMCDDKHCPARKNCYRSPASGTEPSEYRQSWADFQRQGKTECVMYWPTTQRKANDDA